MAATARQTLIAQILAKCNNPSAVVAYVPTASLNSAVDGAGIQRRTAADGLQEVVGGQSPDLIAVAIEAAMWSAQPQLAKAIFQGEQQRAIALLQAQSTTLASQKTATDAAVTAEQGVSFS